MGIASVFPSRLFVLLTVLQFAAAGDMSLTHVHVHGRRIEVQPLR